MTCFLKKEWKGYSIKLKLLLLNKEQYSCFNFLSKVEVNSHSKSRSRRSIPFLELELGEADKVKKILDYFVKIGAVNNNEIDSKILGMLDHTVVNLLNEYLKAIIKIREDSNKVVYKRKICK